MNSATTTPAAPAVRRPRLGMALIVALDPVEADVMAKCLALRPGLIERLEPPATVTVGATRHSPAWLEVVA